MELISQSAWAKKHGFSRQYANQLIREGIVKSYGNGKINPTQADSALAAVKNPSYPERRVESGNALNGHAINSHLEDAGLPTMLLKTRIKNEMERGKILEARAKSETRELVSAEQVRVAAFNKARIVRDVLLNIPDRVASIVASIADEHKVHEILTTEIRIVLEELSRGSDEAN